MLNEIKIYSIKLERQSFEGHTKVYLERFPSEAFATSLTAATCNQSNKVIKLVRCINKGEKVIIGRKRHLFFELMLESIFFVASLERQMTDDVGLEQIQ